MIYGSDVGGDGGTFKLVSTVFTFHMMNYYLINITNETCGLNHIKALTSDACLDLLTELCYWGSAHVKFIRRPTTIFPHTANY